MDWISWSSGLKGAARRSVSFRTARKASTRSSARLIFSENNDTGAAAMADTAFVTGVLRVAIGERWPQGVVPQEQPVLDRGSLSGKKPPKGVIGLTKGVTGGGGGRLHSWLEMRLRCPWACQPRANLLWMHNHLGYIYGVAGAGWRKPSDGPARVG